MIAFVFTIVFLFVLCARFVYLVMVYFIIFFFLAHLFFRLRCDTADSMKWKALFHFPTSLESLAETGEFIKFVRNELA